MGDAQESNCVSVVSEASVFPILNTAFDGENTHNSISIDLPSQYEMVEFIKGNDLELPQILQVAWGILLQCYTGTDRPLFRYLSRNHPSRDGHGMLCSLELEEDKTIAHLARNMVYLDVPSRCGEEKQSGTAVLWNCTDRAHLFDVCFEARTQKDAWDISLRYWTSILSENQASHATSLLGQAITEVTRKPKLGCIDLCTTETMNQLGQWNSELPEKIESCVHEPILERCKTHPEAQAVSAWDGDLTYRDLDHLSHQLAFHLAYHSVGPEKFVGLYFEKSKWTAVAVLAVMRAGGAFVFLDISLPQSRMQEMCRQLNVVLILSSRHLTAHVTGLAAQIVPVDSEQLDLLQSSPDLLQKCDGPVNPNNALFAQFTSGSTGNPKGIVISHLSYCSGQNAWAHYMGLNATSRVLQFASYAFDASIQEILTTLMVGGCVCVPSDTVRKWNVPLAASQFRLTHLILTPTVARLLQPSDITSVETLLLAGEPVLPGDIEMWQSHVRLINGYGPSECCVSTTLHTLRRGGREAGVVGSGIGALCWITDPYDCQKLVPIGAIGELLIEGPTVGRGYIGDPKKTDASFIPSPHWRSAFPDNVHGRMYRTGDLAQYVSHGKLRIIGRRDEQVKIHGQRLELKEVEHHMRDAFGVKQAVADLLIPAEGGNIPILAGFILKPNIRDIPNDESIFASPCQVFQNLAQTGISKLSDRLPRYMVPSIMIPMMGFPTTRTGKIDRVRLRNEASKRTRAQLQEFSGIPVEKRVPVTPMEHLLQRLIEEVLHVKHFGMNDNFFSLGGDSVLAMRLTQVAREEAGIDIPGENIFREPVLSDLAKLMRSAQAMTQLAPFSLLPNSESKEQILQTALKLCRLSSVSDIEDIYPCTPLQEGIMALSVASSVAKYVTRFVFQIPQAIDIERLKGAWTTVLNSNPILRTRIIQTGSDKAVQVVIRQDSFWHQANDLESYLAQDERKGIQIGTPLLRLALIQEHGRRYLAFTIHHTLYDGWSLPRTFRQVEEAYYGETPRSQPFKLFVDHVLKLDMDKTREFWRTQLDGFSGPLFPQPPSGDYSYRPAQTHKMERLVPISQATEVLPVPLATIIELSWALTLSQYSGTDDIVFGSTLAGRNVAISGIDEIIGPTITTIPMRIKLDRSIPVHDLLPLIQKRHNEFVDFSHLGLQSIATLGAGPATACRFQSLLVIQPSYDEDALSIFNNSTQSLCTEIVDNYILTLEVKLGRGNTVQLEVEYDAEVIADLFMSRILEQFSHNLNCVIQGHDKPLLELASVNTADFQTLLTWNNHLPETINCCVHDIINRKCWTQPCVPAVIAWDGKMTYEELGKYSTKLAVHLQGQDVHSGVYVMIYVGKSLWTVVAMLAVMKAGGAFVLIDPAQPIMRLRQVCEDTKAKIVITSGLYLPNAVELNIPVVRIDTEDAWKASNIRLKEHAATPDSAVYAVFTSGSTGKPKGVMVQHKAFITSAIVNGGKQHVTNNSRVLQLASFTFDVSIAEIIYPLVHGGCVCIPTESDSRNNIEKAIDDFGATWATLTPSLARILDPQKVKTLRTLALGGEAMTKLDITMWAGRVQLANCYGPAECSVDAVIQPSINPESDPANIGRGAAAVSWIVDPTSPDKLRPIGAPGELLLEGPILAEGYIGDPEKTASAFMQYPDWLRHLRQGRDGRVYRTGDLVQYNAESNGTLRYLGRIDNQVKLRGQRIELGEVEQHLSECFRGAKQITVDLVTLADPGAHPILAAFVLLHDALSEDDSIITKPSTSFRSQTESAQNALKSRLPNFMIPALFLPVSRIPLSASGKADRSQLGNKLSVLSRKDLQVYSSSESTKRQASSTEESVLQQAVSIALKIPLNDIGMDDNFFHLGGDSLSAMRLVGLLRDAAFTVTIGQLFSYHRLADVASMIHPEALSSLLKRCAPFSLLEDHKHTELIGVAAHECNADTNDIEDIYPCTPMQEALMALTIKQQDAYVLKMVFKLPNHVDISRLKSAWGAVFDANPILRTRIIAGGPNLNRSLQVVLREKFEFSGDFGPLIIVHGQRLCKASISCNDNGIQLHLWLHHSLYDGYSLSSILEQAERAYKGAELGLRPFNTFAKYAQNLDSVANREFWKDQFQDLNTVMFPPSQQRPNISSSRECYSHSISIQQDIKSDFTLPMFIHLACGIVLGHYTASDDIVYGLTLSGRNAPIAGIEDLTGPTIATVPFRVQLPAAQTTKACLVQIQSRLTQMIPHEQTGLQNIRPINQETAAACDFQCHVIIQPSDESSDSENELFKEPPLGEDIYSNFASSPLVLIFSLSHDKKNLKMTSNFDMSHLNHMQVVAMSHQLDHVLQQVVNNQELSITEIDVISPHDLTRLSEYNNEVPQSLDHLVHDIVLQSCHLQPSKIAIDSWDGLFSYGELYETSSRLAQHFVSIGIGTHPVTVICMEKSRWTVAAILAVLQTGSACALVDPSHPRSRIQSIVDQSAAKYAVVSPITGVIMSSICANIITVAQPLLDSPQTAESQVVPTALPTAPSFVIFTSGSTGTPKGVVLEHRSIVTGLKNLRQCLNLDKPSRVLHFVSYAFDMSLMEILISLVSGSTLFIPSETDRNSNLAGFVNQHKIDWAFMTPSASSLLLPSAVPSLKTFVLGGEPLTSTIVDQWSNKLSLVNLYGPAECTFAVAVGQIPKSGWIPGTIGPIVNGTGWITTPSNPRKLAAWGAIGELLVEGPTVGREYIGDPEKTAASFVDDPPWISHFHGSRKRRLYRTGDLVSYTDDGLIRYVGRKDRQVKLNGQRIELEEVESHLWKCLPPHATVIVELVAPRLAATRARLCAFICLAGNQQNVANLSGDDSILASPDMEFLHLSQKAKQQLSVSIPRYMVPGTYIPLNYIPLTSSGKTNRRLFCELAASLDVKELDELSSRVTTLQAPNNEMEALLVEFWAELLGMPTQKISASDSFLHIGGDSISAMRLTAIARRKGFYLTVPIIFSHPVLSNMASKMTRIYPDLQTDFKPFELLSKECTEEILEAAEQQCSIAREFIDDAYPCTPLQEGLVSLSIRTPGAYLAHFSYSLAPNIDASRFKKAWQEVASANSILRTRIIQAGLLYQVVLHEEMNWITIDCVNNYASAISRKEMHLGEPLVQFAITKPNSHGASTFVLAIHHVLYDGWSLPLILDQVQQAYKGQEIPTNPFARFMSYIMRPSVEQAQEYWRMQLQNSNSSTFPSLPSVEYKPFTDMRVQKSAPIGSVPGITNATILQLAWALLLSQYSDTEDIIFGLTLSGRTAGLEGIESVTGPTITTVPLRFHIKSEDTIIQALHRLQEQIVLMTSFEQFGLQSIRRLGNDAEAACQFQNLLVIQPPAANSTNEFWSPVHSNGISGFFSTYALEVTCEVSETDANIIFDFDQKVLGLKQAERLLSQFIHILQNIQRYPGASISEGKSLDPNAYAEIMEWNAVLPLAVERCIDEGVEQQCLESPDAVAVHAWDASFTYKELSHLSLVLAVHLQTHGVGPGVFIPIVAEKTGWVSVAILGVARAGGAIVLLDPSIPFQRLQTIFQDVDARIVVSSTSCADVARKLAPTVVTVNQDLYVAQNHTTAGLVQKASPNSPLYAIFTSGSTGKPKGIIIEHSAFYTSGHAQRQALYLNPKARTLQFASHMFDVSIADYLWTFLTGGCVCIASQNSLRNDLPGVIREFEINRVDLTPSIARILCPEEIPTLETILLGGEPLSQYDVQTWAGKIQLVNGYGPSECSVCCVLADVSPDSDPSNIGKTFGVLSWIVDKDDHNKLIPIGAVGELVLEGHALARGYLNEPEKTAAAFIESLPPWLQGLRSNTRLYKTGDLVQYNADGSLRYVGRKDTQVKIRGQRVELGEIEHQIRETNPAIRDVIVEVISAKQRNTGSVLAAFVFDELKSESKYEVQEDRHSALFLPSSPEHRYQSQNATVMLQKRLPTYMVPGVFIPLHHLPISPSGKVDRRLLREQAASLSRDEIESYAASLVSKRGPETPAEKAIQLVVADTLRIEPSDVGLDDSFFRLGGDSIIAIRFVSTARASGFALKVTDVFKSPKLADLALFMEEGVNHEVSGVDLTKDFGLLRKEDLIQNLASSAELSFPADKIMDVLPVTQSAERMLLQPPEYWILNVEGHVDKEELQLACTALIERHAILRAVFISHEQKFLQLVLSGIDTQIHYHGTVPNVADFVEEYRRADSIPTPALYSPITQLAFVEDVHGKKALILRLSHAQFDGYCLHILWKDLKQLYEGESLGCPVDYSAHLKQWMSSQNEDAFTFWRNTLESSTVSRIDNTIFNETDYLQKSEIRLITSTQRIYPEHPPKQVTTATVVKAAWSFLLARLLNTEDAVFTQTSNGRNNATSSTQDVVGPCLNLIPVRAKLLPSWTALDLMQFLQRQHHNSLDYELLDFRQIVEHSTSWPSGTTHQSNLVHQNIDPDLPFPFGEAQAQVTCSYEWPYPPDEILIESRPLEDGGLQITLDTSSDILNQQNADWVVDRLCRIVCLFSLSPEQYLESVGSMLLEG